MKVRELIEELNDPALLDAEVIISADSEGNSFRPFSDWSIGVRDPNEEGYDNLYDIGWSADESDMDEDEWEKFLEDNPRTLVLWP